MKFTEDQPRNSSKTSESSGMTGSIEIGVIIMGLSCVCVVACALVVLQVRSASRQRQRRRRQRSSTVSVLMDEQESFAPPSYAAVIRSPHLYPRSPRSSVASVTSTTSMRRESVVSSISRYSSRILSCSRVSPDSRADTNSATTQSLSYSALRIEDLEDPPPPYPGSNAGAALNAGNENSNNIFIDLRLESSYYDNMEWERNHGNRVNTPRNAHRIRSSSHGNEIQRDIQLLNVHDKYSRHHSDSSHGNSSGQRDLTPFRGRSASVACTSNFLLPSQVWDSYPRQLTFDMHQPDNWSTSASSSLGNSANTNE